MKTAILFTVAALTALSSGALASGACPCQPPPPPRPRAAGPQVETLDNARYALGKQIYSGRLPLPASGSAKTAAAQRPRLSALSATTGSKSLGGLAGRLTEDQLAALEYYVSRRNG